MRGHLVNGSRRMAQDPAAVFERKERLEAAKRKRETRSVGKATADKKKK